MPKVNCCVPNCVATTKRTPQLNFYQLPVDEQRKKHWQEVIRNDNLRTDSKWTSVCSLHFVGGKKTYLNRTPSIFPWSAEWPSVINEFNTTNCSSFNPESPKLVNNLGNLRPLPLNIPKHSPAEKVYKSMQSSKKRRRVLFREPLEVIEENIEELSKNQLSQNGDVELEDMCVEDTNLSSDIASVISKPAYYPETHLLLKDDLQHLLDNILSVLEDGEGLDDITSLKKVLTVVIKLLKNVKEEFDVVTNLRDWDRFLIRRFEGSDDDIRFWTGFYSYDALMALYTNLLKPKVGELNYWGSVNTEEKDASHSKGGPKRKLQPIDEMFLTLVKLKQGSANIDLGERFGLSESHVSRIFTTWVKFMHCVLSSINTWMSRSKVQKYMPKSFKDLYKDVQVIIDCTELKLQRPTDFECQSATYSSYKHCNTFKGLVGISPSGVPTFVSQLFEGSISDNQITFESGLLKLCQPGEAIMADRGFTCREAMAKQGIRLVIPHFLGANEQLSLLEITESVAIARVRIHVERAMGRIKQWHILSRTLPATYWNCANEIFQLCTKLVLFWPPLIDEDD